MKKNPDTYQHAVANAFRIAAEMTQDELHQHASDLSDVGQLTAQRLASIEERRGFDWAEQRNDWETVCSLCAMHMAHNGKAPSVERIQSWIKLPLVGATKRQLDARNKYTG